jgi:TolB-like protein
VVRGGDLLGDGVNVAVRLEGLVEPGGIAISGAAHGYVRKALPLAYTDLGEQVVKGFDEPVRAFAVKSAAPAARPSAPTPLPLPDKPSIAVLPFTNMSGDPEQEYFADGVVEDILTALSRFQGLFVIARNSSFTYKGKAVDVRQVGRELGVRYVLEGSVRKAAGRVRITAQLIETASGKHLWADGFDGALTDIFDLQDNITSSVVAAIGSRLEEAEIERSTQKTTDNLDAYDHLLRGKASAAQGTKAAHAEALDLFYRAIDLDPNYALAYACAAWSYGHRKAHRWMVDSEIEIGEADRLARIAVKLGKNDSRALALAGGL